MNALFRYLDEHRALHLEQLKEFLRIPSVSTQSEHKEDVARAASWVADQARSIGLTPTVHETKGHPIITAEGPHVSGKPSVLIYGPSAVQPPEPLELWTSPAFEPEVRDGKIYARGAADDKGQLFIHLKVIEAFRRVGGSLPVNVKLLIEGEEEVGSPQMSSFVRAKRRELACDMALISDTHMLGVDLPSLSVGLRGLVSLEFTVESARSDLHSGGYGGAIANPIQVLAEMIAACKDAKSGRIKIPGFYKHVRAVTAKERRMLKAVPHSDAKFLKKVGSPALFGERGFSTLERIGLRPTFELNGIWGGYTQEGVKTVLPKEAHAKVTLRIVPDQTPQEVTKCTVAYLKKICPRHVRFRLKRPQNEGRPVHVDPESPTIQLACDAIAEVFGRRPACLREGGSIPVVAEFQRLLKTEPVLLGFGLPDDNLHAPDEKFDLRMFDKGLKTVATLLHRLATQP